MTITDRIADLSMIWKQVSLVTPHFDRCSIDWDETYKEYLPKVMNAKTEQEFHLLLAGGDPADLAINYGKAWGIVGDAWALLETWFVIKKRDVEISCDFEGGTTLVDARIDLTSTIGRVLWLVLCYGVKGIREYLNFRKKRNGGTTA